MTTLVSVIIPNFNHAAFLTKRINSVLEQTYTNFEVIILDDCSTDNSKDIIEQFSENKKIAHIIYNDCNSGSTFKQWKKGIELAKGEYIWIAESDDYCENNFLSITTNLLANNMEASMVYCKSHRVNELNEYIDDLSFWYKDISETKWNRSYLNDGICEIKNALANRNTIPNASAVLFKKSKAPFIDDDIESFKLSGDWLFWIKLAQSGSICYTIKTTNFFRTHNKTVRNQTEKENISEIEKNNILQYLEDNNLSFKPKKKYHHSKTLLKKIIAKSKTLFKYKK
jgi:glycosyltransferase involved in cell wall biosynthesis